MMDIGLSKGVEDTDEKKGEVMEIFENKPAGYVMRRLT